MQTIPGLVPVLQVGSFEGGQFSANGQATTNNLFLVDGQNDNDSRRGGSQGTQARVSLDSMAEYQVQTHQYGAEYGGSTGVVVNSVTKSGTNSFAGRVFEYYQRQQAAGDRLLPEAGRRGESRLGQQRVRRQHRRPDRQEQGCSSSSTTKARNASEAANLNFPAAGGAAGRVVLDDDGVLGPEHVPALRLSPERATTRSASAGRARRSSPSATRSRTTRRSSTPPGTRTMRATRCSASRWTSVLNNRTTNEFKIGHVRESLLQGPQQRCSTTTGTSSASHGVEPFDVGSQNTHPDYIAGPRNTYAQDLIRDITVRRHADVDQVRLGRRSTCSRSAPRAAATARCRRERPRTSPGCSRSRAMRRSTRRIRLTYPYRFGISMGQFEFTADRSPAPAATSQDKWTVGKKLTLNLGVRYDWQKADAENQGRHRSALRRGVRRDSATARR